MQNEDKIFAPQPGDEPDSNDNNEQEQPGQPQSESGNSELQGEQHEEQESEQERFDPQELLTYEHPEREKIDEIVQRVENAEQGENWSFEGFGGEGLQTNFAMGLETSLNNIKEDETELQQFLEQLKSADRLIDLGGSNLMFFLGKEFNIDQYIGVDRYFRGEKQPANLQEPEKISESESGGEEVIMRADMLDFVSRMPDDSNEFFTINGIDHAVIPDQEYHETLADEILRVTKPRGLIFGVHSGVFDHIKNDDRSEIISTGESSLPWVIRKLTEHEISEKKARIEEFNNNEDKRRQIYSEIREAQDRIEEMKKQRYSAREIDKHMDQVLQKHGITRAQMGELLDEAYSKDWDASDATDQEEGGENTGENAEE